MSPSARKQMAVIGDGEVVSPSADELQQKLVEIAEQVSLGLQKASNQSPPQKDILEAYTNVLKAIADVEKVLPISRKQTITFRLTWQEAGVIFAYGFGGLLLLVSLTYFLPNLSWKAENLLTVLMYWSTIIGILLGVQTLPKIFGKTD